MELPNNETFHYHVGLFLDILTGHHIGDRLVAKATWYVDGEIKIKEEELCPTPYDGLLFLRTLTGDNAPAWRLQRPLRIEIVSCRCFAPMEAERLCGWT